MDKPTVVCVYVLVRYIQRETIRQRELQMCFRYFWLNKKSNRFFSLGQFDLGHLKIWGSLRTLWRPICYIFYAITLE